MKHLQIKFIDDSNIWKVQDKPREIPKSKTNNLVNTVI